MMPDRRRAYNFRILKAFRIPGNGRHFATNRDGLEDVSATWRNVRPSKTIIFYNRFNAAS
jgi:hypothetical protein